MSARYLLLAADGDATAASDDFGTIVGLWQRDRANGHEVAVYDRKTDEAHA